MEKLKKTMTIVALCMATCTLCGQNIVDLVVTGEGKDKEEATFKALRSAIEQAYGTFVSANTTVLNDQLVADEIVSLSSGNIQKYEYVSETKMPNGNTFVTLSAKVSIDKLVSFAESKGMEAELKGSLFAMNIKKMEFDKKAEEKAVENLCKQLEEMLPSMFSYVIKVNEPKINQNHPEYCDVGITVGVESTDAFYSFCSILCNTMSQIALSKGELEKYSSMNAKTYETNILDGPLYYVCSEKMKNEYNLILYPDHYGELCIVSVKYSAKTEVNGDTLDFFPVQIERSDILNNTDTYLMQHLSQHDLFNIRIIPFYFRSDTSITMLRMLYSKLYNFAYNFAIEDGLHGVEFFLNKDGQVKYEDGIANLFDTKLNIIGCSNPSHVEVSHIHHYITRRDTVVSYNYQDKEQNCALERWNNTSYSSGHQRYIEDPHLHTPYANHFDGIYSDGIVKNNRFCTVLATLHYPLSEISKISSITVRHAEN